MTNQELYAAVDHTLLKPVATWAQIQTLCEEAVRYRCASVCIPPVWVEPAAKAYGDKLTVCTVIGFPLGYNTTACKVFETRDAVQNGAKEIDMVVQQGWIKEGRYNDVTAEIKAVRAACGGALLKVIVETCNLSETELIAVCKCVTDAGAEYIKTSTGFGAQGATFEGVATMAANIGPGVKIKAAGGIRTRDDMERFIALRCSRLGTSSAVTILEAEQA